MNEVYLNWKGKQQYDQNKKDQYITKEFLPGNKDNVLWKNMLFKGDLRSVISSSMEDFTEEFQMVYIDPPFFTGHKFVYSNKNITDKKDKRLAYNDQWEFGLQEYLNLLYQSFVLIHKILRKNGSLFVHIDYRASAYIRLMLDEIFGSSNFHNEIIWAYQSGGRTKKYFSRKHDTIYWYSKSNTYTFYPQHVGIPRGVEKRNHMKKAIDEDGRIYFSIRSSGKEYRYYEDDQILPSDVWHDISHLQQRDPERTGYNTQKPKKLLERIILATTEKNDLIGDFFCGSGTTLVAAESLSRRWVGCDSSEVAIDICKERIFNMPDRHGYVIQEKVE